MGPYNLDDMRQLSLVTIAPMKQGCERYLGVDRIDGCLPRGAETEWHSHLSHHQERYHGAYGCKFSPSLPFLP